MRRKDSTIMDKILDTNSSFHVKSSFHYGKVQFLYFTSFLLIFKKNYFGSKAG